MTEPSKPGAQACDSCDPLTRRDVLKASSAIGLTFAAHRVLGAVTTACNSGATSTPVARDALAEQFLHPPLQYAPIDNWWWEAGHVENEKLTLQLQQMRDRGIGGSWFYPRWVYGEANSLTSDPPYWSERWWELTRFSAQEHRRLGLTHYFSNWTATGFQQNLLRKEKQRDPSLAGWVIALHQRDTDSVLELGPDEELIDAAAYRKSGMGIDYSSRRPLTDAVRDGKLEWRAPGAGWTVTAITSRPWDLNYLDKRVGQRFAEAFLGEYEKRLPELMGSTLEAFGADEMVLLNGQIAYSRSLLDRVRAERGRDLAPHLIGLFHDIGAKTDQVRCDYYGAMSALLEENFYRPSMTWLESRGMKHATLSQLGAGDPLEQTAQLGDMFRYLRTFHVPGNEDPGTAPSGERRLMASKLSSSVANLYGRSRTVMCVHYAAGWGQTQEQNLAWSNESYAKGLNLYTRHGNQYTLMGGWYEYVPPADHFHQPVWRYWGTFVQYATRLSCLLSQGKHRADVALFYPITTIHAHWVAGRTSAVAGILQANATAEHGPFDPPAIEASRSLEGLARAIYHDGIDFDFTDNDSLERATVNGKLLEIAGVEFRSIVLPSLSTVRLASMQKVRELYEAGGTVVFFGRLPTASAEHGRDDPKLRAMIEAIFDAVPASGSGVVSRLNARGGRAYFVPREAEQVPPLLSAAIERDVYASEKDVFHLHRKIGEVDVYFLFNVKQEFRQLPVRFRARGRVETWDAFTGETRPVYRWKLLGKSCTEITLQMAPNEGVIVVFSPGNPGPAVLEDDVSELTQIEATGNALVIRGWDAVGGTKRVRVRYGEQDYVAAGSIPAPPQTIRLEGPFAFRLKPTMDNRWGDFRYPASPQRIGAEARRFRYVQEDQVAGTERGWHREDFDDTQWPEVAYSYGPYWWLLGGFARGAEPKELIEQARRDDIDVRRSWRSGAQQIAWQPYTFSKKFGHFSTPEQRAEDDIDLLGVSDDFLVPGPPASGGDLHYWFTNVQASSAGEYTLQIGAAPRRLWASIPMPRADVRLLSGSRAWINGTEIPLGFEREGSDGQASRTPVQLRQGWNTVLLEVVRGQDGPLSLYATLHRSEPQEQRYVPRLRWFREPQPLIYDITPRRAKRVGWYRFKAPPGVRRIRLHTRAKAVQAWVDGRSALVHAGSIFLDPPQAQASQVAVCVEQEPGSYAGAAFTEPVQFDVIAGQMPLGDWSLHGLATYSGIGIYSHDFRLDAAHLAGKVILDLGYVRNVADVLINGAPAGVRLARPFRFDITRLVKAGSNRLEVKVANTLANHMSTYPTRWVLEGQTISGLMGPVEISFHAPVSLTARNGRQ